MSATWSATEGEEVPIWGYAVSCGGRRKHVACVYGLLTGTRQKSTTQWAGVAMLAIL